MTKAQDLTGGNLTDSPNENYIKFFNKFKEVESLNIKDYKPVHIIGYFCKKYKNQYNTDFKFKFNSTAPSKCFEVFQIKKLSMLLSSDPIILKNYIDWVFDNKVKEAKRKLTSISFLTNEDTINFYKLNFLFTESTIISRATVLSNFYRQIIIDNGFFNINTYGDLSFMSQINDNKFKTCLSDLESNGFNLNILKDIK